MRRTNKIEGSRELLTGRWIVNERASSVLRKFGYFAFMGLAALLLAGPLLGIVVALFSLFVAMVSLLAPFAVIGLLVWVPIRVLSGNPRKAWDEARQAGGTLWNSVLKPPMARGKRMCSWAGGAFGSTRGRAEQVGGMLVETTCGAAVGALLGIAAGIASQEFVADAGMGAAAGAVVGMFVGFTRIGSAPGNYSDEVRQPVA
jgi:hypothetical protein